jgi:Protein of unknown function (DUF2917)
VNKILTRVKPEPSRGTGVQPPPVEPARRSWPVHGKHELAALFINTPTHQVIKMDELRTFELGAPRTAQALVLVQDAALCAVNGPIWLTIEGEADDIWLQAGERIGLKAGQRAWLSAEHDCARFTVLTQSPASASGWLAALAIALGKLMSRTAAPLRSF